MDPNAFPKILTHLFHKLTQSINKDSWEKRFNRQVNLDQYIMLDKVPHISIEDAGFDKMVPATSVQRLYEEEDIRDVSAMTSVLNIEFEKILCGEAEQDAQSLDMNLTI